MNITDSVKSHQIVCITNESIVYEIIIIRHFIFTKKKLQFNIG